MKFNIYNAGIGMGPAVDPLGTCGPDGCDPLATGSTSNGSAGVSNSNQNNGSSASAISAYTAPGLNAYYFSSSSCPACASIKPLTDNLKANSASRIYDISTDDPSGLAFYRLTGATVIPHLLIAQDDQVISQFYGPTDIEIGQDEIRDILGVADSPATAAGSGDMASMGTMWNNIFNHKAFKPLAGIGIALWLFNKK